MPHLLPAPKFITLRAFRRLGCCLALFASGCAAHKAPVAIAPQAPAIPAVAGTIAAIRPVTSSPDPSGALTQIMTILSQPAPQALTASEFVLSLPDGTVKTSVQPTSTAFSVGARAGITTGPDASIQPF